MAVLIAMLSTMLLGLPALVLHECGHLAAARLCGVKVKKVGISWIGLFVLRESGPRWANLVISFSGPFVNLLLASALWSIMPSFAQVNLFIGVGSLIPVPKSDGKRILTLLRPVNVANWNHQDSTRSGAQGHRGVGVGDKQLTLT